MYNSRRIRGSIVSCLVYDEDQQGKETSQTQCLGVYGVVLFLGEINMGNLALQDGGVSNLRQ
jgi:hypothetical protein